MRVHFSFIVAIFVAFLLVSGTTGCVSKGGPWYSPSSYTFANPFDKKEKSSSAPIFGEALPNAKPSLDGVPDIGTPKGGYTDATSFAATPSNSVPGTVSSNPPEHWGQQNHIASQSSPSPYGGYTSPSQYSPYTAEAYGGQSVPSSPYQYSPQGQAPSQYAAGTSQYPAAMPYGDTTPPGYQMTSAVGSSAYPQANSTIDNGGGNYAPYAVQPQYDPSFVAQQQQPVAATLPGYSYTETASNPYQTYPAPAQPAQGYPSDGFSVAQPYQQIPGNGYNYSY